MIEKKEVPVWDIAVRIFHWSLVVAFAVAYLTEDDFETLHVYAGYLVLGLISFRVIWGLIGTRHARFSDFVCGMKTTELYLKSILTGRPKHYLGHNPAGGMMIVVMLVSLFLLSYSGLATYAEDGKGPLAQTEISIVATAYAHDSHRRSSKGEFWEEIHEFLANFTLLLIFIHLAGVAVSSLVHRENLVTAMVTGKKCVNEKN
jgi:cytochrome b